MTDHNVLLSLHILSARSPLEWTSEDYFPQGLLTCLQLLVFSRSQPAKLSLSSLGFQRGKHDMKTPVPPLKNSLLRLQKVLFQKTQDLHPIQCESWTSKCHHSNTKNHWMLPSGGRGSSSLKTLMLSSILRVVEFSSDPTISVSM